MAAAFRRRVKRNSFGRKIMIILILAIFILNIDNIGRFFFPFPYRETTEFYARAYHVDPFLLAAMMKTESNFDLRAVSGSGARGLMQIMPDTGHWIADQIGDHSYSSDRLFDPETSIKYGAWYVADLRKEFNGDAVLILAAYNGGRGNVKEWLNRRIITGGENTIEQIPFSETRYYVKKVLLRQQIYSYLYNQEAPRAS